MITPPVPTSTVERRETADFCLYLRSEISRENEDLHSEMRVNTDSIIDSILSSLKLIFPQIYQKEYIIKNTPRKTSNVSFSYSTTRAIPEDTACVKLQDKSKNNKDKNITSDFFPKGQFD